jgi:hypothetical protein
MKKLLTAKHLSLLMLLSLLGGNAQAGRNDDDGYRSESRDCGGCYECGCNPLYCGAWDLQVQGGVVPILWRQRGAITGFSGVTADDHCTAVATTIFDNVPRFRQLFKVPWIVGGQVGYAWSDNTRVYIEFNYMQARGKSDLVFTGLDTLSYDLSFAKYKLFDAYAGVRYYWDRWCDRVSFFLGGKVGFTHHKSLSSPLSFSTTTPTTPVVASTTLFNRSNMVSGGGNVGFDVCFCGNWSFVITGEVVAACGPAGILLNTTAYAPSGTDVTPYYYIAFGGIGTELRFPVTAAIRYSF